VSASHAGLVDLHSHLIPGVDDGARTAGEAVNALVAMAAAGCDTLVTTPHFDASLARQPTALAARLDQLERAWDLLGSARADALSRGGPHQLPAVFRGAEVMLDDNEPDLSHPGLRLAGGDFVLVEFPALQLPPNADVGIAYLVQQGWRPIVAHPERYRNLTAGLEPLRRMREVGAYFQVNAGSITGQYGSTAGRRARQLLELGWASLIASDYHGRGTPALRQARAMLDEAGAAAQALQLMSENPRRILIGAAPLDVAPLKAAPDSSWWQRLIGKR